MRTFCFTPTTAFLLITPLPGSGVERVFSGAELVGLLWQTVSAFLRITTNPKLLAQRLTLSEAADMVDGWLEQPNIRPIMPGDEDWTIFRKNDYRGTANGCADQRCTIGSRYNREWRCLDTTDRDFARFPGLRWKNPLL